MRHVVAAVYALLSANVCDARGRCCWWGGAQLLWTKFPRFRSRGKPRVVKNIDAGTPASFVFIFLPAKRYFRYVERTERETAAVGPPVISSVRICSKHTIPTHAGKPCKLLLLIWNLPVVRHDSVTSSFTKRLVETKTVWFNLVTPSDQIRRWLA